jgi:proteasome accessory factor B
MRQNMTNNRRLNTRRNLMRPTRQRDLLLLAQELSASSKGLTMAEMMVATERSRRTVERMLDTLAELGVETETTQAEGEHHLLKRWRLTEALPSPLLALDEDERLALEGVAVTMPDGTARRALVKLLASQRSRVATGVAIDAHTLIDRTAYTGFVGPRYVGSERLIGLCERAIVGFEQVVLSYRKDGDARASARRIKPLGLLFGRFGYLVGLEKGTGVRTYRLNCIEEVQLVGKTFKPPSWFNLKRWVAESFGIFHGDERLHIVLRFNPEVADRLARLRLHPSQRLETSPDGTLRVHLHCRGHRELFHELLHPDWHGHVVLEQPASLVSAFHEYLTAAATAQQRL